MNGTSLLGSMHYRHVGAVGEWRYTTVQAPEFIVRPLCYKISYSHADPDIVKHVAAVCVSSWEPPRSAIFELISEQQSKQDWDSFPCINREVVVI